jgi:hypothetical protein
MEPDSMQIREFLALDFDKRREVLVGCAAKMFEESLNAAQSQGLPNSPALSKENLALAYAYLLALSPTERIAARGKPSQPRATHWDDKNDSSSQVEAYVCLLAKSPDDPDWFYTGNEAATSAISDLAWSLACDQRLCAAAANGQTHGWPTETGETYNPNQGASANVDRKAPAEAFYQLLDRLYDPFVKRIRLNKDGTESAYFRKLLDAAEEQPESLASLVLTGWQTTYWSEQSKTTWQGRSTFMSAAKVTAKFLLFDKIKCRPKTESESSCDETEPVNPQPVNPELDLKVAREARKRLRRLIESSGCGKLPRQGTLRYAFDLREAPPGTWSLRGRSGVYACAYHLLGHAKADIATAWNVTPAAVTQSLENSWTGSICAWTRNQLKGYEDEDTA